MCAAGAARHEQYSTRSYTAHGHVFSHRHLLRRGLLCLMHYTSNYMLSLLRIKLSVFFGFNYSQLLKNGSACKYVLLIVTAAQFVC